jgi:hypothetical protein
MAEQTLSQNKEYELYGRYLEPDQSFAHALQLYNIQKKTAASTSVPQMRTMANNLFSNQVVGLVSVLAMNDRAADADRIAAQAAQAWNDPTFLARLEEAKKGVAQ